MEAPLYVAMQVVNSAISFIHKTVAVVNVSAYRMVLLMVYALMHRIGKETKRPT
jgi:hypothetical protein